MANPQPTDAHLRVAHTINEAIMMRDFSKRQRKILDLILRLSWGCNKKDAIIPRQRDFQAVGIGEGHIKVELIWLAQSHIITIDGDRYSFNKDFDQWQVSRVRPFTPEKLTELVSLNLNNRKAKEITGEGDPFPYSGYFYLAKGHNDIYKIGVSKNTESRMESFAGLPFELVLLWDIYVKDATKIEAEIKREYKHKHIRGEWYRFTDSELKTIRELTETVRLDKDNLPKQEGQLTETVSPPYQNSKLPTPKLASPKERLNKILKKDIYILPTWIEKETWEEFLEMRKKIRAVPTEYAKVLLVKKLEELRDAGDDPNEILKRSIMNGWKGVFPLDKKGGQDGTHRGHTKQTSTQDLKDSIGRPLD